MESVLINSVEFAVKYELTSDCVSLTLAVIVGGRIKEYKCLVPHGFSPKDWTDDVPDQYKHSAVMTLNSWLQEERFEITSYDGNQLRYDPDFRGYGTLPNFDACNVQDFRSASDPVKTTLQSLSFTEILKPSDRWYLTPSENKAVAEICSCYIEVNQEYIQQKSREFAQWWSERVGSLGDCGDGIANMMHAMLVKNEVATQTDVERFAVAVYSFALSEFKRGFPPFLDTDYGPGHELNQLLQQNNLTGLVKSLPWKTWHHLDFSDMPAIELVV